jgi:radical SAM superfamily enzyme YgiQ (UPF0313 family)
VAELQQVPVPGIGEVYFKHASCYLTISENLSEHYSFDSDGRWLSAYLDGVNYRCGLDGTVLSKQYELRGTKARRRLDEAETLLLIDNLHSRVARVAAALPGSAAAFRPLLQRALDWNAQRLAEQRSLFQQTYRPVSILPPDQYRALVLQAAEGCSWNRCTFCSFYRDRPFRIKSAAELRQHIRQVRRLLGATIELRTSIFLGDANALIIPQPRLRELLDVVHDEFEIGPASSHAAMGLYSFLDIFGAKRKQQADYRELHDYGLRRIYIGLETGDRELFAMLNKPGSPQGCIEAVHTIKAAGIAVGVIILAGVGGDRYAEQHLNASIDVINAMDLDAGDVVYVSPLIVSADAPYSQQLEASGAQALDDSHTLAQIAALKAALYCGSDSAKVSLYHIEEFLY